jgi:hypothetical protein
MGSQVGSLPPINREWVCPRVSARPTLQAAPLDIAGCSVVSFE